MVCYVFPHVPKCGGTSMLRHLEQSGLRVHFDYSEWVPKVAERDISADFDVIYGHFPITRYIGPDYRYIALVRDPLERAISSYKFHHKFGVEHPRDRDLYSRIGRWIDRGELSVREYIRMAPDIRTVYKYFLGYWPREKFDLIGSTEDYDDFLSRLNDLLGVDFKNAIRERASDETVAIPEEDRQPIRALLAEEIWWTGHLTRNAPLPRKWQPYLGLVA